MPKLRNVFYSMGNFANTFCQQVFSNRIQFYYLRVLGLDPGLVGAVWSIFGLWNAVNDPLMGQLSDRTRSRWGRRIPYILFGALPLGLSFFFLWTVPQASPLVMAGYFLATVFIYDTLYTLLTVAYNSLFTEIATDVKQRSGLASLRESLAVVALLLAFIIAPILSRSVGFVVMGVIVGAITAVGYAVSVIGNKEDPRHMEETPIGLRESLRLTLGSVPFRWYLGANLMKEYIYLILAATLPFWVEFGLGIKGPAAVFGTTLGAGDQEAVLLAVPFLLCIPCLALWRVVTPRIGSRRAWMLASLLFIPGLTIMFFARDFSVGLLGTSLIAPGLSGYMMLPIVVLSDVIDDDAHRVGVRREGIFFGISGAVAKLSFTAQGLFYWITFALTGWRSGADVQTESAVWGIRFMMAGSPLIAALITIACLWFIRLRAADPRGQATPAVAK